MNKLLIILGFLIALIVVFYSSGHSGTNDSSFVEESQIDRSLEFWGIYDLPEVYDPIIRSFRSSHPNIQIRYKQFSNAQEYHSVLLEQLRKGKGPDILLFQDKYRDLYRPFITPTSSKYAEGFAPLVASSIENGSMLYSLPFWVDSLMIYYNNRYYPNGIASNWYEFAHQTQGISIGGIAMGRFDNLKSGWDILKALFIQKNIQLQGKADNSLYDTLEFFTRFAYPIDPYYNWNEKLSKSYPEKEIESFLRGKVAAIAAYPSLNQFLLYKLAQLQAGGARVIKPESISPALFPQINDKAQYLAKSFQIGVSLYSQNPHMAWEFIRLLTNESNAQYYSQATGRTSGRILDPEDSDEVIARIQKEQLPYAKEYEISSRDQEKIANIVQRAILDKRVLKEVLDEEF